jgi:hypothetical protein
VPCTVAPTLLVCLTEYSYLGTNTNRG